MYNRACRKLKLTKDGIGLILAGMLVASRPTFAQPASNGLEPDARALLQHCSEMLAKSRSITLDVETLREVRLADGRVATLSSTSAIAMRRPNGLRVDVRGEATLADVYYDGKSVVVYSVAQAAYAEQPAPDRVDALLPVLEDKLGIPLDVGDLLVTDPFARLAADTSGEVVSAATIGGVPAWHMVLHSGDTPWEFWVRQDATSLPILASVTRSGLRTVYKFDDWRLDPALDPSLFRFTPFPGVIRVPFVFRSPAQ